MREKFLVRGQAPQANLAGTFEDAVDGEVALEDEIAAVLDLVDGVKPVQVHRASLPVGEFRSQQQSPVVQARANHLTGETIGSRLQGRDIVDGEKRIVILAEADLVAAQFLFDEGVTVEIVGGLEGKKEATRITIGPSVSSRR